jgi:hypothetical protein
VSRGRAVRVRVSATLNKDHLALPRTPPGNRWLHISVTGSRFELSNRRTLRVGVRRSIGRSRSRPCRSSIQTIGPASARSSRSVGRPRRGRVRSDKAVRDRAKRADHRNRARAVTEPRASKRGPTSGKPASSEHRRWSRKIVRRVRALRAAPRSWRPSAGPQAADYCPHRIRVCSWCARTPRNCRHHTDQTARGCAHSPTVTTRLSGRRRRGLRPSPPLPAVAWPG